MKAAVARPLARFPGLYTAAIAAWRPARWGSLRLKWRLLTLPISSPKVRAAGIDSDRVFWICPGQVTYCAEREFDLCDFRGDIVGGNWDTLEKAFEELDVFVAVQQSCVEGMRWEDTVFYQRCLQRIEAGEVLWDCRGKGDLDRRCAYIELLYQSVKREGYKSREELKATGKDCGPGEDEVAIAIGRHGDLLFSDGAHRLAIAKVLNIERIPVKVSVRHPEWVRFRRELLLYAKELGGRLYQPATHIDLADIAASHGCEDRFRLMRGSMTARRGRLLDIGAHLGYFCHRFEDEGFECWAIEDSARELHFLRGVKRAQNKGFRIIAESVLDCREVRCAEFDVVLALNVFHHFPKTRQAYGKLIDLLANLRTRELFLESAFPTEPQMRDPYCNYTSEEFVDLVLRTSQLTRAQALGQGEDGRIIYRLWRSE